MVTAGNLTAKSRCRLCGGSDTVVHRPGYEDDRLRFFRCRRCGLINRDLSSWFDAEGTGDSGIDPADDDAMANLESDRSFQFLQRFLSPPGRLLDIGCGNGRLMLVARRAGWDVKGLERSADRAQRVRERLGAAVVVANLAQIDPDAVDAVRFDVLCLHFGLERVPDSVRTLTTLRALLAPSGHVLVELTNAGSWSMSMGRVRGGSRRPSSGPGDGLVRAASLFNRAAFEFLIRKTGFDLVRWETYSGQPLADLVVRRIPVGRYARALIRKRNR
jgi:SAM-dependent methyltransferase